MRVAKRFALLMLTGCAALSLAGCPQKTATAAAPPPPPPDTINTDKPITLSSEASATHLVSTHYVSPYMAAIKVKHLTGTVLLHALITKTGTVSQVKVVRSTDPMLSDAAVDIVQHWTYKPYIHYGRPVEVDTTITVNFAGS
jgi:TonB family protein